MSRLGGGLCVAALTAVATGLVAPATISSLAPRARALSEEWGAPVDSDEYSFDVSYESEGSEHEHDDGYSNEQQKFVSETRAVQEIMPILMAQVRAVVSSVRDDPKGGSTFIKVKVQAMRC